MWEVIYAHFCNWDSPSNLVLVVYDLIELIIEASLWTKDYSTFDIHRSNVQWMLISFVCLCMFKCDVCVLNHIWIKPKRFLFIFLLFLFYYYYYYFLHLEVICITHVFQSFSNCFCVKKDMFSGCFCDLFHE